MAILKAPLMSLGAAGAVGKALVFFAWKGFNVVREYVIPANPKTTLQNAQRALLTEAVAAVHAAQAIAQPHTLDETDIMAYALWGSTFATPRTWFNQVVKNYIDQHILNGKSGLFRGGDTTPVAAGLDVKLFWTVEAAPVIAAGDVYWGTSKTALVNHKAAACVGAGMTCSITGLTKGVKYFWQFRPTTAVWDDLRSGIYYGVPT